MDDAMLLDLLKKTDEIMTALTGAECAEARLVILRAQELTHCAQH
jgi:hypothetical protein